MAPSKAPAQPDQPAPRPNLQLQIQPFGPDQAALDAVAATVLRLPSVRQQLRDTRHRLLSMVLLDGDAGVKSDQPPQPPDRFRATVYDYTHNRALYIDGRMGSPNRARLTESGAQPLPSREEFGDAVAILARDPNLGPALREKRLTPYPPMPPLIQAVTPIGRAERTIAVGLWPTRGQQGHEIVGVNMVRQTVIRFENRAPATSMAGTSGCGLPNAGQSTVSSAAGQVWVTVKLGTTTLWRFLAVRPAASSGTNGSGVELRYLDYKGKRLLYRAHVPILNVKYVDTCGPYRDWQNEEGMLQATGSDVAPGFRLCSAPAKTILDTGSDSGNFLGTAIYVDGMEVVLVCEMEAGWYRYVSEWRLHADGTVRPRFGFTAVTSSCVCKVHHHHAYWRLDFDLRTPGNNLVREYNDPSILAPGVGGAGAAIVVPSNWHDKLFEIQRPRSPSMHRKWRVVNTATGEAYDVIPGPDDGVATASPDWPFPRGDVWIVRWKPGAELDDGSVAVGPPYEAGIDGFVNGESIKNQDIVMWYGAHFTHDVASEPPGSHGHVVGPTLKLVKW